MAVTRDTTVEADLEFIGEVAQQLRVDGIRASTRAGSGHPTSGMSAADLIAVLTARHMHYDWDKPERPENDHLIFSKGHASPLLYALYKAVGVVDETELMTYRTLGSRLQGHPTPILPWVDVATGSLGQGLPIAVGVAMAGKYLDELPYHVWVLCGDSEIAEGSIWEGLDKASHYRLDNLCAIIDVNRLGQRGETEFGWDLEVYRGRVEAFGCRALVIDGHNLAEIDAAYTQARATEGRPTVIIARTVKGKGFSEIENHNGWHGKALPEDMAERAIAELGGVRDLHIASPKPEPAGAPSRLAGSNAHVDLPVYKVGDKVATRKAYGDALLALGARSDVVVLDGEVSNSTYSEIFQKAHQDRFFEMFIAEQEMIAAATGMAVRGYVAFASTFAAFHSRAYDFVRMAGVSEVDLRLSGSHAGCEIGADGPSQMALEDLAAFRAIHSSTVLYPSDATSTARLVQIMADLPGISYMRTTRGAYPVLYEAGEHFEVGGSKVLRSSNSDQVTLIGAGVTLHNCLAAADRLRDQGVAARVIDLYSVKPVDVTTLREASRATGGRFLVVEDHYAQGGLAAAVLEGLAEDEHPPRVVHLCVRILPGSGPTDDLLRACGIDADSIVSAATRLAGGGR